MEEFSPELTSKVGKLDSDPHLWMPVSPPTHRPRRRKGVVASWSVGAMGIKQRHALEFL